MCHRNHDLLPSDTKWNLGPKSGGNAEAFLAYVKNEVVPYVESNYSILPGKTAVGLGGWAMDEVMMQRISPLEREITLKVQDYAEVLFYINGKSRAWINCGYQCRTNFPMMVRPEEGAVYTFELVSL